MCAGAGRGAESRKAEGSAEALGTDPLSHICLLCSILLCAQTWFFCFLLHEAHPKCKVSWQSSVKLSVSVPDDNWLCLCSLKNVTDPTCLSHFGEVEHGAQYNQCVCVGLSCGKYPSGGSSRGVSNCRALKLEFMSCTGDEGSSFATDNTIAIRKSPGRKAVLATTHSF